MSDTVVKTTTVQLLLERWSAGDRSALNDILEVLYEDIHSIAVRQLRGERSSTLRPTALVHEAYLRLAEVHSIQWQDRAHFLAMAARVTRQALIDEARRRRALKRDGGEAITLCDDLLAASEHAYDVIDMDDILTELSKFDAVAAEVVTLRVFGGMSIEEAAESMEVSVATANRRWSSGKAWLMRELTRR